MRSTAPNRDWRGTLRYNTPLSRFTSWRVGGPAERFYRPANLEDLQHFLSSLPADESLVWLGLGSNLLVRDGGIRGTVIALHGGLTQLQRIADTVVRAEAGIPSAKVARFCAQQGLSGVEFMAGIPGTFGGALAMNAGAFGGETWDRVRAVETIDRRGMIRLRNAGEFRAKYRHVTGLGEEEWFVAGQLRLEPSKPREAMVKIRSLLSCRSELQPTGVASCGSVFRNPKGDYAARLIELAGLKGVAIGGAEVSEKHANFIVNRGHARAADIETLIHHVQSQVEQATGIHLIPEVRVVGESA
jgi:UDP-N-acetylmuramate dehydrogenase